MRASRVSSLLSRTVRAIFAILYWTYWTRPRVQQMSNICAWTVGNKHIRGWAVYKCFLSFLRLRWTPKYLFVDDPGWQITRACNRGSEARTGVAGCAFDA